MNGIKVFLQQKKMRTDSLIILRVRKSSYDLNSRVNNQNTFFKRTYIDTNDKNE